VENRLSINDSIHDGGWSRNILVLENKFNMIGTLFAFSIFAFCVLFGFLLKDRPSVNYCWLYGFPTFIYVMKNVFDPKKFGLRTYFSVYSDSKNKIVILKGRNCFGIEVSKHTLRPNEVRIFYKRVSVWENPGYRFFIDFNGICTLDTAREGNHEKDIPLYIAEIKSQLCID
jgi:hypothetical protein